MIGVTYQVRHILCLSHAFFGLSGKLASMVASAGITDFKVEAPQVWKPLHSCVGDKHGKEMANGEVKTSCRVKFSEHVTASNQPGFSPFLGF